MLEASTGTPAAIASSTTIGQLSSRVGSAEKTCRLEPGLQLFAVHKPGVFAPWTFPDELQKFAAVVAGFRLAEKDELELFFLCERVERADESILIFVARQMVPTHKPIGGAVASGAACTSKKLASTALGTIQVRRARSFTALRV